MSKLIEDLEKINSDTKFEIECLLHLDIIDETYEALFEIFHKHNLQIQRRTIEL